MPKKCLTTEHEKLKMFNHDAYCTKCGTHVNPDALVTVDCEKEHQVLASRGLKFCPECGEKIDLS